MNIYIETNFVLELVFQQEQYDSCEEIIALCEKGLANLVIPAYCLAEPHEKLRRQSSERKALQQALERELRQLGRTSSYTERINSIREVASLFIQSNEEEKQRFDQYRNKFFQLATIIPLTRDVLSAATVYEGQYGLSPQDALVYASVIQYVKEHEKIESCFLNKNTKDFDNPDIDDELTEYNCKMIPRFDQGLKFILNYRRVE